MKYVVKRSGSVARIHDLSWFVQYTDVLASILSKSRPVLWGMCAICIQTVRIHDLSCFLQYTDVLALASVDVLRYAHG